MKNMGKRIEQSRENKHLSQRKLGEKLNPPVTRQTISRWEAGDIGTIKRSYVDQVARILNVDPVWLMGYEDSPEVSLTYEAPGKEAVRLIADHKPIIGKTSKLVELYNLILEINPDNYDIAIKLLKTLV